MFGNGKYEKGIGNNFDISGWPSGKKEPDYLADFKFFMGCANAKPKTADKSDELFESRYKRLMQIVLQDKNLSPDEIDKILTRCSECAQERLYQAYRRENGELC